MGLYAVLMLLVGLPLYIVCNYKAFTAFKCTGEVFGLAILAALGWCILFSGLALMSEMGWIAQGWAILLIPLAALNLVAFVIRANQMEYGD